MTLGIYIAIGFLYALVIFLGVLLTMENKHYTKRIIAQTEGIPELIEEKIEENLKKNIMELNPEKAYEVSYDSAKKTLRHLDNEFIKYYNDLTAEEKQQNSAEWFYKRVRLVIYEKFQEIEKKNSELKQGGDK